MILTVCSRKGGVGKSTTSVILASLLARNRPTVLVDADRDNATATTWHRLAIDRGEQWPVGLTLDIWPEAGVPSLPPPDLSHVVIDTPPGGAHTLDAALRLSDTALAVVAARDADSVNLGTTLDALDAVAAEHALTWGVLVTFADLRTREAVELPAQIDAEGLPRLEAVVPENRTTYGRAFGHVPTHRHVGAYAQVLEELTAEEEADHGARQVRA